LATDQKVEKEEVIGLGSLPRRQVWWTLAGVFLAMFLSSLDQTIVSTAMPRIVGDLGGFSHYTWLTTVYVVTSTVVLPIVGKLTDMYGRKYFYVAGIAIFILGSLLSGLSQSMLQIIIFRGIQGIGAGIMMVNAFTVIADIFPPAERGKYIGLMSAVFGVSAIIGPILGGFLTDALSWHWIFFINIPLGIVVIILFLIYFPNFRMDTVKHRIDYPGIVVILLAVIPLMLALSSGGTDYPWLSWPIITMFVISALAIIALPFIEMRSQEPIIPLEIFRNPIVAMSIPIIFFTGITMFGGIIFIPLYFQGVMGLSATESGGFLTPMLLGQVFGTFVAGQLLSRAGGHYRILGALGIAIMAAGIFLISRWTPDTGYIIAIVNLVMTGFGLGITLPVYTIAVQNAVPYNILGATTSMVPFFRAMGGAAGLAVLGSIMSNRFAAEFLLKLPENIKSMITPEALSSVTNNMQALVSPEAQAQFQSLFSGLGQEGQILYQQMMSVLKAALDSSLSFIFFITFVITAAVCVLSFFIKEVPLRKKHVMAKKENDGS
jgi:EmrB/QacA subfamily drug resistance transporter